MRRTSLRNLTKKTLFLLALASAKRVSEIHSLDKKIGFSQGDAICSFTLGFLAKNERPSDPWPESFRVKNLSDIVGHEDDERSLCPVRALRYYLDRTEKLRGPSASLWCSVKTPSRPLSKNAISYFLRELIRESHSNLQEDGMASCKVRAHEIRAVATSLAFRHNMSLSNILKATFWKCRSVFASHYLKEVETTFNNCSTLGSLSVAGMVLGEEVLEVFLSLILSSFVRLRC